MFVLLLSLKPKDGRIGMPYTSTVGSPSRTAKTIDGSTRGGHHKL